VLLPFAAQSYLNKYDCLSSYFWYFPCKSVQIACLHPLLLLFAAQSYLNKYDCLSRLKPGGVLVLNATWIITCMHADVSCCLLLFAAQSYLNKYDCLSRLKPGGVLVLNATWKSARDMEAALPGKVRRQLAALAPQLYVVDARAVADAVGLGKRINMVMQTGEAGSLVAPFTTASGAGHHSL
jgi:hypothetical protein